MVWRWLAVPALLISSVHAFVAVPAVHTRQPLTALRSCGPSSAVRDMHRSCGPSLHRTGTIVSVLADDGAAPKTPEPPLEAQTLLFLVGAAALWGTYPTCVKLLYAAGPSLDPSIVVLVRFLIMAAVGVSALLATTPKFTLLKRYKLAEAASMPWKEQIDRRVLPHACPSHHARPNLHARPGPDASSKASRPPEPLPPQGAVERLPGRLRARRPGWPRHLLPDPLPLADPRTHRRGEPPRLQPCVGEAATVRGRLQPY